MKVYAVIQILNWEGCDVPDGIFTSKDVAEKYAKTLRGKKYGADRVEVCEYTLDEVGISKSEC
jgi:hypothetical protein